MLTFEAVVLLSYEWKIPHWLRTTELDGHCMSGESGRCMRVAYMYSILAKKSIIWSSFLRVSTVKCTLHCMPSLLLFYFDLHFRPDVFGWDSMSANPPVLSSFQAQC